MWDCEQFLSANDEDFAEVDNITDEYHHSRDGDHSEEEHFGSLGTIKGTILPSQLISVWVFG